MDCESMFNPVATLLGYGCSRRVARLPDKCALLHSTSPLSCIRVCCSLPDDLDVWINNLLARFVCPTTEQAWRRGEDNAR